MKSTTLLPQTLSVLLLVAALAANSAWATNVIKQDTVTMEPNSTDWSAAPGPGDIGEFDATISSGNEGNLTLGANLSIGGLQFDGTLNGPVTIGADGNTLTLNNAGTDLDASVANQGVTINCAVGLAANQTWNVASGQLLTVGGIISGTSALTKSGLGTLTLTNKNTYTGTTTIAGGALQLTQPASSAVVVNNSTNVIVQSGGTLAISNRCSLTQPSLLWVQNGGAFSISGSSAIFGYVQFDTGATLTVPTGTPALIIYPTDGARNAVVIGSVTLPAAATTGFILDPQNSSATNTQTVQFDGTGTGASANRFTLQNGTTTAGGTNTTIFNIAHSPSAAVDLTVVNELDPQGDNTRTRQIIKQGTGVMQVNNFSTTTVVNYDMVINGGTMIFSASSNLKSLTVNSGTLQVPVGYGAATPVSVAATSGNTATLAIAVGNVTKQWGCSSLTVNNAGTSSGLQFNFGVLTPSTTVAPLNVTNGVTFTTAPTITISGSNLPVTSGNGYPLMTWGSGGPSTTNGMTLVLPSMLTGSLSIVGSTLYLQVTGSSTPKDSWAGGNGIWDVNDSTNTIWKDINSVSTYYVDGNAVVFDNTVGSGGTVTLNTNVSPASITVTNPTADYTISGSGGMTGNAVLTKSGAGKLTLTTTNSFSGVTINGGTLQIGNGITDGSIASAGGIADNGVLAFNLVGNQTSSMVISGTGALTMSGAGMLILNVTNTYTGTTTVAGGTLLLTESPVVEPTVVSSSTNVIVQNGSTLAITNRSSLSQSSRLWVQNGGVFSVSGKSPYIGWAQFDTGSTLNFPFPGSVAGIYITASDAAYNAVMIGSITLPAIATNGIILDPLTVTNANTQTVQFDGTGAGASIDRFTFLNANTIFGGTIDYNFNIAHSPLATVDIDVPGSSDGLGDTISWDPQGDGTRSCTITKEGTGIMQIDGTMTANSVNYDMVVNGGSMIFNNIANLQSLTVNSGMLGGIGALSDTTIESGGTISPGTPASPIGTLTIADLTMNSGAIAVFNLNKSNPSITNDYLMISGGQSITGCTLTVSNLGPALVVGDTFTLFSQPTSGFTTVNLPSGYTWSNNLAGDGSIQVLTVVSAVPSPTNITYAVSNNQLVLNWPAGQGWMLQAQTNNLGTGLSTNWVDVTGATPPYTNSVNPANPTVFYRLKY